jgi:ParB family transcriptional regulator, chromosome partitioning protein
MSEQSTLETRLEALLEAATQHGETEPARQARGAVAAVEMSVDELRPGRYQPRQRLSEESLAELADSIREQGVLQPLVVRPIGPAADDSARTVHEIVAGERRWQAAKLAGLSTVPVIVRELDDQSALAVALIENLQREDLNPIDQARSLARLASEFKLTHEQVAKAVGRSRASVSNLMRLLDLNSEVKELLAHGRIDMGHARALLPLDAERQVAMARKAERRGLSVRQVESAVRTLLSTPDSDAKTKNAIDLQTQWLERQIARELGTKLAIRRGNDGTYHLQVEFADLAQLQDALQRIQELISQVRDAAGPRAREADKQR